MCFQNLTTPNLTISSFLQIKHTLHRQIAATILCMSCENNFCIKNLLSEKTVSKRLCIIKNDKEGTIFELIVVKKTGVLSLTIQRNKFISLISIDCLTSLYDVLNSYIFYNDCNENWVKVILFEFDKNVVNYIQHFSGKNKSLKKLIQRLFNDKELLLSVHIDIPNYILII
jgi:hypothetical protein